MKTSDPFVVIGTVAAAIAWGLVLAQIPAFFATIASTALFVVVGRIAEALRRLHEENLRRLEMDIRLLEKLRLEQHQ